jgi:tetratricopeptide (TPR) repeat protein
VISSLSSLFRSARTLRAAIVLALLLPAGVSFAQQQQKERQPNNLSEKASEVFTKIGPLVQGQKWDEALGLLNALIPQLAANSYDLAEVLQTKGKLLLQKEEYAKALEPLEKALALSDANDFFDKNASLMLVDFIAKLYAQEAVSAKDPAIQKAYFAKAVTYFKRWLKDTPKQNPDISLYFAQVLVQQATVNQEKPDINLIREARVEVDKVLKNSIKPKESAYQLLYFILQQEGQIAKSAEILELLVKQYPTKSNYWQQLMATYNTLAAMAIDTDKNPEKARQYYVRAINTIERAQAQGFLKSPKDQYNLVVIYSQAGQFGRSTELLYSGLKNGAIESDVKNWLLLSYAYLQVNQELRAIAALKEATKIFPQSGQLEFNIGQLYSGLDKPKEANEHYRLAMTKGGGDKPFATAMFLAWTSYELGLFEDALEAIKIAEAKKTPQDKDDNLPKMKDAIQSAIREREEKKNAATNAAAPKTT